MIVVANTKNVSVLDFIGNYERKHFVENIETSMVTY